VARHDDSTRQNLSALPEGFLWDTPQWIRTDHLKAHPAKFIARVLIGGFVGLLFGRVLGSLQGLFLQWVYDGVLRAMPGVEGSVGRIIHAVAAGLGTMVAPLLFSSPLSTSLSELRDTGGGSAAILFLAQLHGSVNGIFQGVRPTLGDRCQTVVERVLLGWGMLWRLITRPLRALIQRPPSTRELHVLLSDAGRQETAKKLMNLLRRGLLPTPEETQGGEEILLAAWPGKIPPEKRPELWWTKPAVRVEVYRWIESTRRPDALPLLARGLNDPDPDARRAAVVALAALGTQETVPYLVSLLDEGPEIRTVAVAGLKRCAAEMEA
jgi:hypothetical protein